MRTRRADVSSASGLLRYLPVTVALLFIGYSLHRSDVDTRDLVVFTCYVALGLLLPGLALWRLLVNPRGWSLLADLAAGISLAYAVELGVYLVCAHADHPGVAWVWPVAPLAASLHPRLRSRVWRRAEQTTPLGLSWVLSGLVVYSVAQVTRTYWDGYPLDGPVSRAPYVDIPYHLSLIGALSRHVPANVPAVDGEPLYYHWFFHAEMAAARHATGIEPLVLLSRLGPLVMTAVIIVGTAVVAHRLTRSNLAAGAAAVVVCGGSTAPYVVGPAADLLAGYLFPSPTTAFAMALLVAPVLVVIEYLDDRIPMPWPSWAVLAVSLGAISGAKGSLLPVVLGGLASVIAMRLLIRRRLHRRALGVFALGAFWFLLAQQLVYGGSSQGTDIKPFGFGDRLGVRLKLAEQGHVGLGLAIALTVVYLISLAPLWAGLPGLFTRDAWRDPRAHFLVGCTVAATGAVVVFDNAGFNQVYFLRVAPPLIAVAGIWGLAVLVRRLPREVARSLAVAGIVVGLVVGWLVRELYGSSVTTSPARLLLPPALALITCVAVGIVLGILIARGRSLPARWIAALLVAGAAVAVLGQPAALANVSRTVFHPAEQFDRGTTNRPDMIGRGGVASARWLRDHSDADDLVATNVHCAYPNARFCDHRSAWVAGFTERQILLEGWAYTSRSAEEAEKQGVATLLAAFWDPKRLRANDWAFWWPTARRVNVLHDRYGVRWMFADTRFRVEPARLDKVAKLVHREGDYAIYRLG